jgi:hypothetical protein
LFENVKVVKVVATEEKINKIINNLSLDIEKSINEVDKIKQESPKATPETNNIQVNQVISVDIKVEEKVIPQVFENIPENTNSIINDSDIITESQNISPKV